MNCSISPSDALPVPALALIEETKKRDQSHGGVREGGTETRFHKTKDFNMTQGGQVRKTLRKTIKDRQTLTEWTGAYKDRTII